MLLSTMSDLTQLSQLFNLLYPKRVMDFVKSFVIRTNFDQTINKYGFVFWLFLYFTVSTMGKLQL